MHEMMVAESLLATISDEAAKHKAKPINARISCGMLNAVNDDALVFAFGVIAKGTCCEGIKLQIEHKPIQGRCRNCKQGFDFKLNCPKCPNCNSEQFELLPDAPLLLEQIEFETEQNNEQKS